MTEPVRVRARERNAILQSLGAGVVPRIGLHLIQVGRHKEIEALIRDLKLIEDGSSAIRYVVGRFGSGKSFFLNLLRTVALERKHVVLQADITLDRRFYSNGGHARALYTELVHNMATRARPEGGAMPGLVERFVTDVAEDVGSEASQEKIEDAVEAKLRPLRDMTHGTSFIRVMARYVEGYSKQNDDLRDAATRWLRGEYTTKTEAREDLGVRDIVLDAHLYDMLKVWAGFVKIAGYAGMFVSFDEMVVLSERLGHAPTRSKNYEVLLHVLNDCLQGNVQWIGFCFAGTPEFLEDQRRGVYSYEALRSRLATTSFGEGVVDMNHPVIRLAPLSQEELFVLLDRIALVHAEGKADKRLLNKQGIKDFMEYSFQKLGAKAFQTPRDSVKEFVTLLNIMKQHPKKTLGDLIGNRDQPGEKMPEEDGLTRFKM